MCLWYVAAYKEDFNGVVNIESATAVPSVRLISSAVKLQVFPMKLVHKAVGLSLIARVNC